MKGSFLKLVATVIEQDTDILNKLYQDQPQKIKLNNEVGIDWPQRNFESWPAVAQPNLFRQLIPKTRSKTRHKSAHSAFPVAQLTWRI
ncbi:MAG: hypothetical protein WA947_00250 [Phormidesmis sp.]